MQINLRQNLKKDTILQILDDPILNEIEYPNNSIKENVVENIQKVVDIATQMTDRAADCNCSKLTASVCLNENNDVSVNSVNTVNASNLGISQSFSKFANDFSKESNFIGSRYTSPLFKVPSLSSQVFKHRIDINIFLWVNYIDKTFIF